MQEDEISILLTELSAAGDSWGFHYLKITPESAPLRHGKTIYIQSLSIIDDKCLLDNKSLFPATIATMAEKTGNHSSRLARSYWHRLKPGDRIDVHRDRDSNNTTYFQRVNRYQVFPVIPRDFIIVMDGKLWNFDPDKIILNQLIYFNQHDWHYYANHSSQEVNFLVMDFFKS